jgi:ATP-dependent Clp protease protease subunit
LDKYDDREIWVREFKDEAAHKFREQILMFIDRYGEQATIPIYVDSYGGYVDSLAMMLETMDSVPNRFITVASGKAMSCGAILLSHGDIRWCGPLSRVMIHNIHGGVHGDAYEKLEAAEETMRMQKLFMSLLAKNCNMTYAQLEKAIKETTSGKEIWLGAKEAVNFGIADHVGCPRFIVQAQVGQLPTPVKPRLTDEDRGVKRSTTKKNTRRKNDVKRRRTAK